jgi:hypothetical protein
MAACDNLYGNREQWQQLHQFLSDSKPEYLIYLKEEPSDDEVCTRICYIPEMQQWLLHNCPIAWVHEELETNMKVQEFICGEAH